jgi:hypothetical protein
MTTTAADNWRSGYRQQWPSATDNLAKGTWRQPREQALMRRYIQANPSALLTAIVIDIDHEDALYRAASTDARIPMPNYVAQSPSGRGHAAYVLEAPVCKSSNGRQKPLDFAARVETGLVRALDGDRGYTGFLTKNPLHDHWDTWWGADRPYSLSELAGGLQDWLPKSLPRKAAENTGLGRNVALFNRVRLWSYSAVRRHWSGDQRTWEEVTLAYALNVNQEFMTPLDGREVQSVARSISRYVWRKFTPETFKTVQAERGSKGGAASAAVRSAKQVVRQQEVLDTVL